MKRHTYTTVLIALLVVTVGAAAWAQHEHKPDRANDEAKSGADRCQMMADHMQQMQAMMKKMDQRLGEKVKKMNQASGDDKIDAMADVIDELVTQRQHMHDRMAQMRQKMMGHMAQHMQMGMNEDGKKAMMHCPMMKQMMQDKPMMGGMHGDQPQGQSEDAASRHEGHGDKRSDHRQHDGH